MRLEDRTSVVTGSGLANSVGWGIAKVMAREGAKVAVFDINESAATQTAQELKEAGADSLAYTVDVSDYQAFRAALDDVIEQWGHLDILCNNAGIANERCPIMTWDTSEDEFDRIVAVNCKGTWNGCRAIVPYMMGREYGKIINISSIVSKEAYAGAAVYTASKFFINGLTSALAKEVARSNVNVNAVAPGLVRSPCVDRLLATQGQAWGKTTEGAMEHNVSLIPMGRPQSAEDIGNVVAFLASEEAKEITGQCFSVDGGGSHI
jgi:meso-butanediol dehydrogenase/(S,S)-butanediol dehydrogenase/diacetyl reductase